LTRGTSRPILVIAIALVLAGAAVSGLVVYGGFLRPPAEGSGPNCSSIENAPTPTGFAKSNSSSPTANFLIVESDSAPFEGMNGSYYHTPPFDQAYNSSLEYWPIIQVYQGQMVTITVMNCASSEPHGFAIGHYFNSGVTLGEGQRYIVTFQANTVGKFSVYCNVLCAIHPYMQNGLLIVS
jgi:hypothetical protein